LSSSYDWSQDVALPEGAEFGSDPVAVHPNEPLCFLTGDEGFCAINTNTKSAELSRVSRRGFVSIRHCAMTPDGAALVCAWHQLSDDEFRLFQLRSGEPLRSSWRVPIPQLSSNSRQSTRVGAIGVVPDGTLYVALVGIKRHLQFGIELRQLSVGAIRNGRLLHTADLPKGTISQLAFVPHQSRFATCAGHAIHFWEATDPKSPTDIVRNDTRKHFTGIAFHPSRRYLAATSNDETVKLYDTTTWEVARTFTWDIGRMRSVAFSPDGTLAAAGSDKGKVVVWDVDV
jgi:WD40 repeat protein